MPTIETKYRLVHLIYTIKNPILVPILVVTRMGGRPLEWLIYHWYSYYKKIPLFWRTCPWVWWWEILIRSSYRPSRWQDRDYIHLLMHSGYRRFPGVRVHVLYLWNFSLPWNRDSAGRTCFCRRDVYDGHEYARSVETAGSAGKTSAFFGGMRVILGGPH